MKAISFFAVGIPKAMPRPRAFVQKLGCGSATRYSARVYNPSTAEGWKSCVAEAAKPYLKEMVMEPVALSLIFILPRPKGHFLSGNRLRSNAPMYHSIKPDCDNLSKSVMDALKVIGLLSDDSIVVQLEVLKLYTMGHRTGCQIDLKPPTNPFKQ